MNSDSLILFNPKNRKLQKYIKTYYIHSSTNKKFKQSVTYFPNYTSTLNIYKNSKICWPKNSRTHIFSKDFEFTTLLVVKIDKSREINYKGCFNKTSIVFHPLGLNNFIRTPLSNLTNEHFSFFNYYGQTFNNLLPQLFNEKSIERKCKLLDEFFLSKFFPFEEKRLMSSVEQILNSENPLKVQDIANELQISRRTLLRLFNKHLSYSVEEYISVVRFRKSLIQFYRKQGKQTLTELALQSQYYDQSDFNRNLKLRSGQNPAQFFSQLQKIEKGLFWKLSK